MSRLPIFDADHIHILDPDKLPPQQLFSPLLPPVDQWHAELASFCPDEQRLPSCVKVATRTIANHIKTIRAKSHAPWAERTDLRIHLCGDVKTFFATPEYASTDEEILRLLHFQSHDWAHFHSPLPVHLTFNFHPHSKVSHQKPIRWQSFTDDDQALQRQLAYQPSTTGNCLPAVHLRESVRALLSVRAPVDEVQLDHVVFHALHALNHGLVEAAYILLLAACIEQPTIHDQVSNTRMNWRVDDALKAQLIEVARHSESVVASYFIDLIADHTPHKPPLEIRNLSLETTFRKLDVRG